jgi:hypothetical protein
VAEILEQGTIKVLGIVNGDLLRNSIATDDVLPEELLDGGKGCVHYRLHFNPFSEVFHYDNGEGVVSLPWCKLTHDVYASPLLGPGWSNQLRRLHGGLVAMREFLTSFAN